MPVIEVVEQDILRSRCEAITNSANMSLLGMGGVSGAILRAGGREMVASLEALAPAQFGDVVVTRGFGTGFDFVLHAVADPSYLAVGTYAIHASVIAAAERLRVRSLALPAIGMGIFNYPPEAVEVSVRAVVEACRLSSMERVEFVVPDAGLAGRYREALARVG
jgi:O-acetyl-ADP-ribose deacetylase (regulator of RNase III)